MSDNTNPTIVAAFEEYLKTVQWSPETTDEMKTLVLSNVRGFVGLLAKMEYKASILTMRDQFAMAALQGLLSDSNTIIAASPNSCANISGSAYEYADAMLEAR